jgi:type IV secretion system protein VirD4
MLMDEFPLLGRVSFFEKSLRLLSGYGVKVMFVAQSLNDIVETYGAQQHHSRQPAYLYRLQRARSSDAGQGVEADWVTAGDPNQPLRSPAGLAAGPQVGVARSQIERPLLEPGEIRALPDDIQLVFAAGARPLRDDQAPL